LIKLLHYLFMFDKVITLLVHI